jgi:endonuclease/exonuclease/phosphatase family metal-dependent hydrolase
MKTFLPLLFLLSCVSVDAQNLRIMTYNLLAWSESNEDGRTAQMQKIFTAINPDIIVMQEVVQESAINKLRTSLGNRSYNMMEYKDIEDTECSCFYDPSLFSPISAKFIATTLRDISVYNLLELKTQDTFRIYTAHFKASDDEATQRAEEAQLMYSDFFQYMNRQKTHIIAAGDFNIYSPQEQAYSILAGIRALPTLHDHQGSWERNSTNYLIHYTQATRTNADGACGGGVGGGIDDRFDYVLVSESLKDRVLKYVNFGNDGKNRLNSSIDNPQNEMYGDEIAQALRCASDHLPVYLELSGSTTSVDENEIDCELLPEKVQYFDLLGNRINPGSLSGHTIYLKVGNRKVEKYIN